MGRRVSQHLPPDTGPRMTLTITYSVFAIGLTSVEGSPVRGFLAGAQAIFGLSSADFHELPALRGWIQDHGGTVLDETGTPAPATCLESDHLYTVTLGAPSRVGVRGIERVSQPCAECQLPVTRLRVSGPRVVADRGTRGPVSATVTASWMAEPRLVEALAAAGLADGLAATPVETPAGPRSACWPDRLLASHEPDDARASRCSVCGRNVARSGGQPTPWVPRFSLGLLVDRPDEPHGWWWHASLGQHLPIVSGDVVRFLREDVDDVTALPVIVDPAAGFLPEEYRS